MYSIDNFTVSQYLEKLAEPSFPSPASGSAISMSAAMAAGLLEMSYRITINKDDQKGDLTNYLKDIEDIRNHCLFLASEDINAFAEAIKAGRTKKEFPEEYETALKRATDTLISIAKSCNSILTQIEQVYDLCYRKVIGDLVASAYLAEGAAAAAKEGVEVNLQLIQDKSYKEDTWKFIHESYRNSLESKDRIIGILRKGR